METLLSCLRRSFCICTGPRLQEDDFTIPTSKDAAIWKRVDRRVWRDQDVHDRYWWIHSGYILAILLYNAGYSPDSQYRSLKFFLTTVVPSLGISRLDEECVPSWLSFMTDDGMPVEVSWDWGSGKGPSNIRFSIVPV